VFYNRAQSTFIGPGVVAYEPDPSRPSFTDEFSSDYTLRLTWQAAEKHKIAVQSSFQPNCNCLFALLTTTGTIPAPEGTGRHYYNPNAMPSLTWSYPASNRVLFEGGVSANLHHQTTKRIAGVTEQHIQITDQALNMRYGARASSLAVGGSYSHNPRRIYQGRFSMSYIPGSHNVKVGLDIRRFNEGNLDKNRDLNQHNQGRSYTFLRAGVPRSVTLWAVPHGFEESLRDVGLYAQDQWRIRNLTLNYGLRYNDVKAWTPEQLLVAGYFVPERRVAAVDNVPHWRNLDPRLGAAYDLFGDGRTALKGSLGRYATRLVSAAENPARNMAASTTLNWTDSNNNLAPDCNLLNPKGEDNRAVGGDLCGGYNNLNFGQVVPGTRNAEDALEGFNLQDYNWQGSVSIQHELRPNVGLNVGYFRTWYGNFLVSDNQAIATDGQPLGPSHYDSFCITVPTDDRLPTSGERLCGLYDIRPAEFGKTDNVVTQASNFGTQTQVYNGVDATLNARLAQGMQFQGGISVGRTATDNCFLNNDASLDPASTSPRIDSFCDTTPPWSSGTQFRGLFVYPLPWQLQASVTYQNIPGIPITADQVLSNAQVAPELGRNLAACPATGACTANITVQLVPNGVAYEERLQQLDVRLTGLFRLQRLRLRGNFDVYNIFNANNVLRLQTRYAGVSSSWLNAINVMGGRLVKFGVQVDF
jgi:hypothetical protein